MCENCNAGVKSGLAALEAIANGEEVPETDTGQVEIVDGKVHRPTFDLPFPVIAIETDLGNVGIMTSPEGWDFFKKILEMLGGVHDD